MSLAIRFVTSYLNWELSDEVEKWIPYDEIPADPMYDLRTRQNALSIYLIDDDKSELERCIAGFATHTSQGKIKEIDYVLFDEKIIKEVGIRYYQKDAEGLIDEKVTALHWNIVEISSQRLLKLAERIFKENESDNCDKLQVHELISQSLDKGWINMEDLNGGLRKIFNDGQ